MFAGEGDPDQRVLVRRGDVTDDALDDLLIGAPLDAAMGRTTGAGYIVAGRGL